MENQLDSVTEKPTCFLQLQGLACDWSKHNKHSRNIFSVHGSLRLSVTKVNWYTIFIKTCMVFSKVRFWKVSRRIYFKEFLERSL